MSSKKQITIMVILTVMILAGGIGGWYMRSRRTAPEAVAGSSVLTKETLIVVNTGEKIIEKAVENPERKTALDATLEILDGDMEVTGAGSSAYVTGLAGRKAEADKKEFWEMIVNSQAAMIGAGGYMLQPGDKVEWRINTY